MTNRLGERKILKLSFAESFMTHLGGVPVHCFRDPAKEAAILQLVAGRPEFMQGVGYPDSRGNIVRVLDIVRGINFLNHVVESFRMPHAVYFQTALPDILRRLIPAIRAIGFLHQHGPLPGFQPIRRTRFCMEIPMRDAPHRNAFIEFSITFAGATHDIPKHHPDR